MKLPPVEIAALSGPAGSFQTGHSTLWHPSPFQSIKYEWKCYQCRCLLRIDGETWCSESFLWLHTCQESSSTLIWHQTSKGILLVGNIMEGHQMTNKAHPSTCYCFFWAQGHQSENHTRRGITDLVVIVKQFAKLYAILDLGNPLVASYTCGNHAEAYTWCQNGPPVYCINPKSCTYCIWASGYMVHCVSCQACRSNSVHGPNHRTNIIIIIYVPGRMNSIEDGKRGVQRLAAIWLVNCHLCQYISWCLSLIFQVKKPMRSVSFQVIITINYVTETLLFHLMTSIMTTDWFYHWSTGVSTVGSILTRYSNIHQYFDLETGNETYLVLMRKYSTLQGIKINIIMACIIFGEKTSWTVINDQSLKFSFSKLYDFWIC